MTGFMGMGMAMNNGAAGNAQNLFAMGQQQQQTQQAAAPAGDTWKCACGATASGKFCAECGAKKPEASTWTCSCGAVNNGKFCTSCGAKKPETVQCANCGWKPKDPTQAPKFCPECGTPFNK